jgi:hypothetical protein
MALGFKSVDQQIVLYDKSQVLSKMSFIKMVINN